MWHNLTNHPAHQKNEDGSDAPTSKPDEADKAAGEAKKPSDSEPESK